MVGSLFHSFHNESKALWEFTNIETTPEFYKAHFKVTCDCGAVKIRVRSFPRPTEVSHEFFKFCEKDGTLDKYIKEGIYYSLFGYTEEAALKEAKLYKGDNHHI